MYVSANYSHANILYEIFDVYIVLVLVYFMRIFPDYILMSNAELTFNTTNATSRNKPLNID